MGDSEVKKEEAARPPEGYEIPGEGYTTDPIWYGRQLAAVKTKTLPEQITYVMVAGPANFWYVVPAKLEHEFTKWLRTKDVDQFPVWAFCVKAN